MNIINLVECTDSRNLFAYGDIGDKCVTSSRLSWTHETSVHTEVEDREVLGGGLSRNLLEHAAAGRSARDFEKNSCLSKVRHIKDDILSGLCQFQAYIYPVSVGCTLFSVYTMTRPHASQQKP